MLRRFKRVCIGVVFVYRGLVCTPTHCCIYLPREHEAKYVSRHQYSRDVGTHAPVCLRCGKDMDRITFTWARENHPSAQGLQLLGKSLWGRRTIFLLFQSHSIRFIYLIKAQYIILFNQSIYYTRLIVGNYVLQRNLLIETYVVNLDIKFR